MDKRKKSRKILRSNAWISAMVLAVFLGMAASLWMQSRQYTVQRPTMRTVDVEQIDIDIRAGKLSDVPARHWVTIEKETPR